MAETLKFGNLTMASKTTAVEFLRIAGLFVALMLVQIVQSLDAQAHVRCAKIDELQKYNDPEIATRIEQHYGSKTFCRHSQQSILCRPAGACELRTSDLPASSGSGD